MDLRDRRHEEPGRTGSAPTRDVQPVPPRPGTAQQDVLDLQRSAGNAAVARLLQAGRPVQRLVDRAKAQERVTTSEYKDLKNRLDAEGGAGMTSLFTGQFIRLASLFRKNRPSLEMLRSASLEHLAVAAYETQDAFASTRLAQAVSGFPVLTQKSLISNAVQVDDLSAAIGALSVQSKKHIAVPKHNWVKAVAAPATFQPSDERADAVLHEPSWNQVAALMYAAIQYGEQTTYKVSTFQRVHDFGGERIAVIFTVIGGQPRVSDAWVE
ncbi:polymorphic toxin type 35 domain-containing protein [Occultella kanbiaonis]|uniref:polymorphic toxin type 35 domain-containing protein n=1 Tax=Occultella kanbiaonis TaxID=2675754 RepID=UPI0012B8FA84|nr:polymorphic toxin type 35 domain-containing protein [Occultella kanbiaonis]